MKANQQARVEQAIEEIRKGNIIITVDDEHRENEGDFIQSAQYVRRESVNFMITEGRGLLCCPISQDIATTLRLEPQTQDNTSLHHTAFTVSVDAIKNTSTGVSAHDRTCTIQTLVNSNAKAEDLARPGHIFPIVAHPAGLRVRPGHTEAAIELVQLAGHRPGAAICEILNKDGAAASLPQLEACAKMHNLVLLHIEELLSYISNL